jgi:hypothetical protein
VAQQEPAVQPVAAAQQEPAVQLVAAAQRAQPVVVVWVAQAPRSPSKGAAFRSASCSAIPSRRSSTPER